jgi:hypothetical protein
MRHAADQKVIEQLKARLRATRADPIIDDLTCAEYDVLLRNDFALFAGCCFH